MDWVGSGHTKWTRDNSGIRIALLDGFYSELHADIRERVSDGAVRVRSVRRQSNLARRHHQGTGKSSKITTGKSSLVQQT